MLVIMRTRAPYRLGLPTPQVARTFSRIFEMPPLLGHNRHEVRSCFLRPVSHSGRLDNLLYSSRSIVRGRLMQPVQDRHDILQYLKTHKNYFSQEYHIQTIGLIGSFSRNEQTSSSDIDLIVDIEPGTPSLYELKNRLRNELETQFGRRVEIVSSRYLKPYYRDQILAEAIYA
jgi:predicted nucleotidyltransferase